MDAVEFGKMIREMRGELSVREVSRRSGISHPYLSQLENGKRGIPSPDTLRKLAVGLNVTYEELMERVGYLGESLYDTNARNSLQLHVFAGKSYSDMPEKPIDKLDKKSDNSTHEENNLDPEWLELYEKVMEKGAKIEATAMLRAIAEGKMSKVKLEALLLAFDFIDKKADD